MTVRNGGSQAGLSNKRNRNGLVLGLRSQIGVHGDAGACSMHASSVARNDAVAPLEANVSDELAACFGKPKQLAEFFQKCGQKRPARTAPPFTCVVYSHTSAEHGNFDANDVERYFKDKGVEHVTARKN